MEHRPPAPSDPDETGYQIDDLILDVGQQRVTRAGVDIPLPHLSFALLLTLARAAPNLVTFEQLSAQVWPRLVITPETISQRVKLVRSALGDDPQAPRYITGVRGRGYRMIASVQPLAARRPLPAAQRRPPQESSGPAPAPPVPAGAAAARCRRRRPWTASLPHPCRRCAARSPGSRASRRCSCSWRCRGP